MTIQSSVDELNAITAEIKRLNAVVSSLRKRKRDIEGQITKFLETKEQPGVKYKGMAIIAEDKTKHKYKSKKEKEKNGIETLKKYGVQNAQEVFKEILMGMQGEQEDIKRLKIKKIAK